MNYIGEINSFYDRLETNPLSTSAIALWFALMAIANKANWIDTFAVAISVLEVKTSLKKKSIERARNELKQKGFIEWRSRSGNQSAEYSLFSLCVKNNPQSVPQPVPQYVSQSVPQPVAINKLNYTKLNKEKSKKEKKSDFDFSLIPKEFIPIVKKWLKYKSEKKQTYKKTGFNGFCKQLLKYSQGDLNTAERIIEQSIASNYAGIFELKNKNENTRRNNTQGKVNLNSEGDINEKARTYTDLVNTLDLS